MNDNANVFSNIIEMVETHASKTPNRVVHTFLSYQDERLIAEEVTIGQLQQSAKGVAAFLKKNGVKPGDRVVIASSQTAQDVKALFGILYAGAIASIVPAPLDDDKKLRLASVIASCEPKMVLYAKGLHELMLQTKDELISLNKVDNCGCFLPVAEHQSESNAWVQPQIEPDTIAYLQYSSGSTSAPKGVMVTHANVIASITASMSFVPNSSELRYVSWAPIFHNVGLINLFSSIYANYSLIIMKPSDFMMKPSRWLKAISKYRALGTFAPNFAYNYCARTISDDELKDVDLSSLKIALNGSEPIDYETLELFTNRFSKYGFSIEFFTPGYGLAECTSSTAMGFMGPKLKTIDRKELSRNKFVEMDIKHPNARDIVSCGTLMPNIKAKIVDPETKTPLSDGEIGELWLQSPSITAGYWNNELDTQTTFQATLKGHDGFWLRTGDLATFMDRQLYITGRMKELIIINGHNFYSKDIEERLKHSIAELQTKQILNFSITKDGRERVVTCICLPKGSVLNYANISTRVMDVMAQAYEFSPEDIIFIYNHHLPHTDTQKVQLLKLKDLYRNGDLAVQYSFLQNRICAQQTEEMTLPRNELEKSIFEIFGELLKIDGKFNINDSFFVLGGDSIAIVQASHIIRERLKVDIPLKLLLENPSVANIAKIVENYRKGEGFNGALDSKVDLRTECQLESAIIPPRYPTNYRHEIKNIFLTGATGFVGAYLIRDLLDIDGTKIYTLVRAKNESHALKRIKDNCLHFDCWKDGFENRIIPVIGDLSQSRMGLSQTQFLELGEIIDTVYHNGAFLNFIYPYSRLKSINVLGTHECLRLACTGRPKHFNHISTFSVYDNPSHFQKIAMEDDPLVDPQGYFLGYTESKWVAEKLVHIAIKRGLRANVFRPGEISGASDSGIWNLNDAVIRNLVACIQMGAVADIGVKFHITPVDYISKAITYISRHNKTKHRFFNLVNKKVLSVRKYGECLKKYGYKIDILPFDKWKERLYNADNDNALKPLEALYKEEKNEGEEIYRRYADLEANFSVDNTLSALQGSGISCPPVDEHLLKTYLDCFIKAQFVKAP